MVTAAMKLRRSLLGRKAMKNLDSIDISLLINVHIAKLWFFQESRMEVRVGPKRKSSAKELMLLNSGAGEDS